VTTSALPWTVSASAERIELGPDGRAETTFTVTNSGPVDQRLVLDVVRSDPAVVAAVAEPQRLVPHGGSVSFLVSVTVPAGTPPGAGWLAGRVYSADVAPEESSVLSDRVAFEVKPTAAPRKPNIWIWLIPVIALVLVVLGVVLFLVLRDSPEPPPGPPVHRSGELVVTDDGPFDLDELEPAEVGEFSGLSPEADVQLFGAAIEAERFFQSTDNANLARIGPTDDPVPACEAALGDPIFGLNIAEFDTGDIFCVRTNRDRLSVAIVTDKVSDLDSSVTLQVTTFE
jgi:hypothetical protein